MKIHIIAHFNIISSIYLCGLGFNLHPKTRPLVRMDRRLIGFGWLVLGDCLDLLGVFYNVG